MSAINVKRFFKPTILKILIFLMISVSFFYLLKESTCGVFLYFPFCYTTYGFPLHYAVSGDLEIASGHIKTLTLGHYYDKTGNFLFNPLTFALDLVLIYITACFIVALINIFYPKVLKK